MLIYLRYCLILYFHFALHMVSGYNDAQNKLKIEDFPFLVSIQVNGIHICTGTIISQTHILTTTKCYHGISPSELRVLVGTNDTNNKNGNTIYKVIKAVEHPQFRPLRLSFDVSILFLNIPLSFNNKVKPLITYWIQSKVPEGNNYFIIGWGTEAKRMLNSDYKRILHKKSISITSASKKSCQKIYMDVNEHNTFCGNFNFTVDKNHDGVCVGEWGSPIFYQSENAKEILLVGLLSQQVTPSKCDKQNPVFFTSISIILPFIAETTKLFNIQLLYNLRSTNINPYYTIKQNISKAIEEDASATSVTIKPLILKNDTNPESIKSDSSADSKGYKDNDEKNNVTMYKLSIGGRMDESILDNKTNGQEPKDVETRKCRAKAKRPKDINFSEDSKPNNHQLSEMTDYNNEQDYPDNKQVQFDDQSEKSNNHNFVQKASVTSYPHCTIDQATKSIRSGQANILCELKTLKLLHICEEPKMSLYVCKQECEIHYLKRNGNNDIKFPVTCKLICETKQHCKVNAEPQSSNSKTNEKEPAEIKEKETSPVTKAESKKTTLTKTKPMEKATVSAVPTGAVPTGAVPTVSYTTKPS